MILLGYIEGVAKVRFALSVAAELFHKRVAMRPALLHAVREVCMDTTINRVDDTGHTDTARVQHVNVGLAVLIPSTLSPHAGSSNSR